MNGDDFDPSGLTALVVDENHYERGISLDQLRSMGFRRVIGAANTAEGWEALRKSNPNIVLVEWFHGNGGDGLDFVRRVRNGDAPNRAVSMFMLTARGTQADVEVARLAGVDGYLRKPISALALQQLGFRATVYEQAPQLGEVGAGLSLSPTAVHGLNWLGMREVLETKAYKPEDQCVRHYKDARPLVWIRLALRLPLP